MGCIFSCLHPRRSANDQPNNNDSTNQQKYIEGVNESTLKEHSNNQMISSSNVGSLRNLNQIQKQKEHAKNNPYHGRSITDSTMKGIDQHQYQKQQEIMIEDNDEEDQIQIQLRTLVGKNVILLFSKYSSGKELILEVYRTESQIKMHQPSNLYYDGKRLDQKKQFKEYRIKKGTKMIIFERADSKERSSKFKFSCSHTIDRDGLISLIEDTIENGKSVIQCPSCQEKWDFNDCSRVANFTPEQTSKYSNSLTENLMKKCPKCKRLIVKLKNQTNIMKCECSSLKFCYECLNPWKMKNNQFCGNEECQLKSLYLKKLKNFTLNVRQSKQQFKLPLVRKCPNCRRYIQHEGKSKITQCNQCKGRFCWVCLSEERAQESIFEFCKAYPFESCIDLTTTKH